MKKNLFILGIAALAFAACSNDEVVEVNQGEAISFRSNMNKVTRADEMTSAAVLNDFTVYAKKHSDNSEYFSDVVFTGPTTYTSNPKYYWPSYALDFYAYSVHTKTGADATEDGQVTHSTGAANYQTFTITPATSVANQVDFIYATNNGGGSGVSKIESVPLAFTHKESKIVLKIKNTSANISFAVTGWELGFVKPNGSTTDGGNTWTAGGTASASVVYTATCSSNTIPMNQSTAMWLGSTGTPSTSEADKVLSMILIPQTTPAPVSAYADGTDGAAVNGAYIGITYTATNTITSESLANAVTGIWKMPSITWQPGYQYTYTIDIADGGYNKTNVKSTDENLDPILGDYIKFATVTITDWTNSDQSVSM